VESEQYEELCRLFIAEQFGLGTDDVKSVTIPNARRPGLPTYDHQIDLYWETGTDVALYLNIANAKWRGSGKVDQPDVLLLAQVCQKVTAHKAFMLTNVGFTRGAKAAAKDAGIALHIVKPAIDTSSLPHADRQAISDMLQSLADATGAPIYSFTVECRGVDDSKTPTRVPTRPAQATPTPSVPQTRVAPPATTRTLGGGETRGGPGPRTTGFGSREGRG
jgi:hypothetical protein